MRISYNNVRMNIARMITANLPCKKLSTDWSRRSQTQMLQLKHPKQQKSRRRKTRRKRRKARVVIRQILATRKRKRKKRSR